MQKYRSIGKRKGSEGSEATLFFKNLSDWGGFKTLCDCTAST